MSQKKYSKESPADDLLLVLGKLKYCSEATSFYSKYAGKTVGQMIAETPKQSWAVWYLRVLGKENSEENCLAMIAHITDPMVAFNLYLKLPWLTDKEDKLLEDKFKGKLPTAEKELLQGVLKRDNV